MEGYILNQSGRSRYIFKRHFPVGHRVYLEDLWKMYEGKAARELGKSVIEEGEFVSWLEGRGLMLDGFVYFPGDKTKLVAGFVVESTSPSVEDVPEHSGDGRLMRPSLENAPSKVIDSLTYSEIATLRLTDNPKKIVSSITNISKLRKAYTVVRSMPRKQHLQKVLRDRLQELENL